MPVLHANSVSRSQQGLLGLRGDRRGSEHMANKPKRNRITPLSLECGSMVKMDNAFVAKLAKLGTEIQPYGAVDIGNGMLAITVAGLMSVMDSVKESLQAAKDIDDVETKIALGRLFGYLANSVTKATAEFRQMNNLQRTSVPVGSNLPPAGAVIKVENK